MITVPFKAEHIDALEKRGILNKFGIFLDSSQRARLELYYSFTAMTEEGQVIGCLGVMPYWEGRGEAWAILDEGYRRHFVGLDRAVRRFLKVCPFWRVEAAVEVDFKEGHRWAKLLGFKLDAPLLKKYLPNGKDCALYSIVKEDRWL